LIESQLFGHKKGAFTGADKDFKGAFERADGGTVFIDEIAELPLDMQVKLLRVIQEKTIEPVGANSPISVDVRIIAATHQNLAEKVATGAFRQDLFYRLNVLQIEMPPLREHREDIPWLVEHFLLKQGAQNVRFDDTSWAPLQNHPWPGNVSRAAIHAEEGVVSEAVVVYALKQGGAAAMSTRVLDVEALVELRDLVNECAARFGGNDAQGGTYLPVVAGKLDAMIRTREI
jgi:transcriptional regulator with PAS, ATPase and Fis domain